MSEWSDTVKAILGGVAISSNCSLPWIGCSTDISVLPESDGHHSRILRLGDNPDCGSRIREVMTG